MKVIQAKWSPSCGWTKSLAELSSSFKPDLILFFTSIKKELVEECCLALNNCFKDTIIVGCTSAGEIIDDDVYENTFAVTMISFTSSKVRMVDVSIDNEQNSSVKAGVNLAKQISKDGLKAVLLISDGLKINGSELVKGVQSILDKHIPISGGLAGDGDRFHETLVHVNGKTDTGKIALIGFYGENLEIGHGSVGGWDEFGPVRKITHSQGNILEEIDGEKALNLYKKYLGETYAQKLPGSALLFPMLVYPENNKNEALVRTVLSVDEENLTMTFAGDVPEGYCTQLMRANFDRIIHAASEAAKHAQIQKSQNTSFALLISCVGRKMVLGQRTADEIESVKEILGEHAHLFGFYSYGEISPIVNIKDSCALHNQTMTITLISENN